MWGRSVQVFALDSTTAGDDRQRRSPMRGAVLTHAPSPCWRLVPRRSAPHRPFPGLKALLSPVRRYRPFCAPAAKALSHRLFEQFGIIGSIERHAQHHGDAEDGAERIGDTPAGDIRCAAMNRFVERLSAPEPVDSDQARPTAACRASPTPSPRNRTECRRRYFRSPSRRIARAARTICIAALSTYRWLSSTSENAAACRADHFLAPQHAGFEDIRLVDRANPSFSGARQFEGCLRYPPNLISRVLLGVETAALPVGERLDAARLAEVDAAGELTNDDEVDTAEHVGFERSRFGQSRIGDDRSKICEEIVFAAQAEASSPPCARPPEPPLSPARRWRPKESRRLRPSHRRCQEGAPSRSPGTESARIALRAAPPEGFAL